MLWYQNWLDDFFDMQQKIYDNTLKYSDDLGFGISPVGMAWDAILGEFDIFPLHYLHMSDWNHPSIEGSYLSACVLYSTIFQESCENINYYSSLDRNVANHFQEVASKIVMANAYVKIDIYDILGKPIQSLINDYQNAGLHEGKFCNNDINSGVYFYRLKVADFSLNKKMMLVK